MRLKRSPALSSWRVLRSGLLGAALAVLAATLGAWAGAATAQTAQSPAASHASAEAG